MGWEKSVFAVFDDLEQQAEGLHLAERDAEVADLTVAEYSLVALGARLHASLGWEVSVRLVGGTAVTGRLGRVGEDWLLLECGAEEWIVRHRGIASVTGLSGRADHEAAWSVMDKLSLRAVLRALAGAGERCLVHFVDDHRVDGLVGRVGRDFLELTVGEGRLRRVEVVPLAGIAALQGRTG